MACIRISAFFLLLGSFCCPSGVGAPSVSGHGWHMVPVVERLDFPWGVAFLPDGAILVTERDRGLRAIRNGRILPLIRSVPRAYTGRQGGYLDVAPDPGFANNRLIYISLSTGSRSANRTEVFRARLTEDLLRLENVESIFRAVPDKRGGAHFGSRFAFLSDGTLVFGLGDGYHLSQEAQDTTNHMGAVIRIGRDGSVPVDNPYAKGSGKARAEIFSFGHRNVQGTAYDDRTGHLFGVEHGPRGGDELNLLRAGQNYGWPRVTFGVNYDGSVISPDTEGPGFTAPLHVWVPSIAPSGMAVYRGARYPDLDGDILVSALADQDIRLLEMDYAGSVPRVVSESVLIESDSRIRHVTVGPGGDIYVLTDEAQGGLYRLERN